MYRHLRSMTLVAALAMLAVAPGLIAHPPGDHGDVNRKQIALENGYRDGFNHGRFDRSRGYTYNFHNREFRRADRGYSRDLGEHDDYQKAYREGYRQGYNDGYNGREAQPAYGPEGYYDPGQAYGDNEANNQNGEPNDPDHGQQDYGNGGQDYPRGDVAFQIGFRDGQQAAEYDMSHNKSFRPTKHEYYEDGSHGYRHSFGSKRVFKDHYRQGFLRGYERTFPRQY
jgi:hypothetical protein